MELGTTTRARLVLFGGLYFAQGVPWGFVTLALVLRLNSLGMGPAEAGEIVGVALLPWTLKPLLGPLVDRLSQAGWARRPLLLGAETAMALTMIALALVDPLKQREPFLVLVFANSLCAALQDVVTDSLALATLPAADRGRANGVMSAAKYAGSFAGGTGLMLVAGVAGWPLTHLVAAALMLIPAAAVLGLREPRAEPGAPRPSLLRELLRAFLQRTTLLAAVFLLTSGASSTFLYPLVVARLRLELGISDTTMSLLASLALLTGGLGALGGGWLADRLGRHRTIVGGTVAVALAHLAFALSTPTPATLVAYQIGAGLAGGIVYAATVALCMDLTNPRLAATHFQLYMALWSVRSSWAAFVGGRLAEHTSPLLMFVGAAALELLPLALLLAIDPRRAAAAFADDRTS